MTVLVTCPELEKPGGVANYYQVLRRHFPSDMDYFIVGARQNEVGRLKRVLRFCRDNLSFAMRLKRGRCDLVHLNPSLGPNALIRDGLLLLIAKGFGKKVIIFMRGWDVDCEQLIWNQFLWLFRLVYFRADAFIVLAAEFKAKLLKMGYHKAIYTETTIVNDDVFEIISEPQRQRAVTGIKTNFHILFLSRIEKKKGIYEAIEAYRILKRKYENITMTVAGDGPEYGCVMEYIAKRKIEDIEFCGHVQAEAKHKQYLKADVYVFPTFFGEGMPNSVLEAMAYGLPVITRPVGGMRDFFVNGKMGFITESRDAETFAELIERLITDTDERERMGSYNHQYAKENFAASIVAGRLEQIYRKVLAA